MIKCLCGDPISTDDTQIWRHADGKIVGVEGHVAAPGHGKFGFYDPVSRKIINPLRAVA